MATADVITQHVEDSNGDDTSHKNEEQFTVVKRKRKATAMENMDQEESCEAKRPNFPPLSGQALTSPVMSHPYSFLVQNFVTKEGRSEYRRVAVPPHRYTPLKENWMKIFNPIVEHLKLQMRLNLKTRHVELKTSRFTIDHGALQKACDFVEAFMLGFDVDDALALVRLDDLFIDSFEIQDVKPLKGDHLSRAIGRIAGSGGRTKFTIENVTKTRIVLADSKIHILGSFQNIKVARTAICSLILGSPPSKVYGHMRAVAGKLSERF